MHNWKGFTFIELMVVVAIIAILSIAAFPLYTGYVSKAQVGAALADIRPGKPLMEFAAQNGQDALMVNAAFIGLHNTARCPAIDAKLAVDGVGAISCRLKGNSAVNGRNLVLRRAADGMWTCDAGAFETKFRPLGCAGP